MKKEIGISFLIPSFNPPVGAFCKLLKTLLACTENVSMEIIIGDDSDNGFSFEKLKGSAGDLIWNKVKFIKFPRMGLPKKIRKDWIHESWYSEQPTAGRSGQPCIYPPEKCREIVCLLFPEQREDSFHRKNRPVSQRAARTAEKKEKSGRSV